MASEPRFKKKYNWFLKSRWDVDTIQGLAGGLFFPGTVRVWSDFSLLLYLFCKTNPRQTDSALGYLLPAPQTKQHGSFGKPLAE